MRDDPEQAVMRRQLDRDVAGVIVDGFQWDAPLLGAIALELLARQPLAERRQLLLEAGKQLLRAEQSQKRNTGPRIDE